MLLNYLRIAFRSLARNKVYTIINILGLSLGTSCCLVLALYVEDEMSYDKHHNRIDDVYRLVTVFKNDEGSYRGRSCSPPIAPTLAAELPEVEFAARVLNPPGLSRSLFKFEDKLFYETDGYVADSTVFEVLTYDFIEGNPKHALTDANTVVISDRLAQKLFGKEPALNNIVTISMGGPDVNYKITGVFRDNVKGHIHSNFIVTMRSDGIGNYILTDPEANSEWAGQNFIPSYLRLVAGHDKEAVVRKMNEVLQRHGAEDMKAIGLYKTLDIEPVKDIYLKSDAGQSPRITYTYVIGSIAVFILVLGCINFMNLSTAKATQRAGEIGIRKVMGALRSSLIRQIMGEAMVIVLAAIVVSIILVQIGLPYFNLMTGKQISLASANFTYLTTALAAITIITGLLAGSYPAFYLSSFEPAAVLKGKFLTGSSAGWLRQSLVVFQFMIAIILVCGMLIISRQLNYMQEKDLGFDVDAKIVLPIRTDGAKKNYDPLRKQLLQLGQVSAVSGTEYVPGTRIWSDMLFYMAGGSMENTVQNHRTYVDYGYLEQMGIQLIAGRSFIDNRETESKGNVIINRASTRKFGVEPEKMVGQQLYFDWQGEKHSFTVIGVVEDHHQTSPKAEIPPTMFRMGETTDRFDYMIVSINPGDFKATVEAIETQWRTLVADTPFEYSFLDENIQKQYDEDRKVSRIITGFTLVAMLISCMGLYGLSSYLAERRFKEIGVRKVLGASVRQIVVLMTREFARLILIAFAIAVPAAWYGMDKWLSSFAYRTNIDFTVFVAAGAGALFIALITVSFESVRAASANPVESLRME